MDDLLASSVMHIAAASAGNLKARAPLPIEKACLQYPL